MLFGLCRRVIYISSIVTNCSNWMYSLLLRHGFVGYEACLCWNICCVGMQAVYLMHDLSLDRDEVLRSDRLLRPKGSAKERSYSSDALL